MVKNRTTAFFDAFKAKYARVDYIRAHTLLIIQFALTALICAALVLVLLVTTGGRLVFYIVLMAVMAALLGISLALNIKGHCKTAIWLVMLVVIAGPWLCILLDSAITIGDYVPLVYTAISIQLCAVLLPGRATLVIGLMQLGGLAAVLAVIPSLQKYNWPSLMAFIVFVAALGIATSMLNRRQLEQIEKDSALLRQSEALMQELALKDSLTGLYNRRYMEETVERELNRAIREKRCLGVIMADVDGFKQINDTYGHALGDAVLCRVAQALDRNVRRSDVACRFGGDEFILILPECALGDTVLRAQALRRIVESTLFMFEGTDIGRVTISVGVGAMPEHGETAAELLKAADKALYAAKRDGRNRVVTARVPLGDERVWEEDVLA